MQEVFNCPAAAATAAKAAAEAAAATEQEYDKVKKILIYLFLLS